MAQQSRMDVNSWQAARRQWNYCPALQFFARMVCVALIDCKCTLAVAPVACGSLVALALRGADPAAVPTDEALLARDWIARSLSPADRMERRFLSFDECCAQLSVDAEKSRVALLAAVDAAGDYDTDENWERLAELIAREPMDDFEPLFDAPRIVAALDQMALF
jgi:hypothetical protein